MTPVGDSGSHDDMIVPVSQPSSSTVDNIHSGETPVEQWFTCGFFGCCFLGDSAANNDCCFLLL